MSTFRLKRIGPGIYAIPNREPAQNVVRTEWDGPQGGTRYLWEISTEGPYGWCIEGDHYPTTTLREMREQLAGEATTEGKGT